MGREREKYEFQHSIIFLMPDYRVAKEDQILDAIRRVFARRRVVNSQRELKKLVEEELKSEESYKVGGKRLRHVVLDSGIADLEIRCRESPEKRRLTRCPVCETRLKEVRNLTVFGGTVTLGFRCSKCAYWSGLRRRIPMRYVFTRR